MKEEEKSKPQAIKADIDHTDLVQAQKDRYHMAIIEKIIPNKESRCSLKGCCIKPSHPCEIEGDGMFRLY